VPASGALHPPPLLPAPLLALHYLPHFTRLCLLCPLYIVSPLPISLLFTPLPHHLSRLTPGFYLPSGFPVLVPGQLFARPFHNLCLNLSPFLDPYSILSEPQKNLHSFLFLIITPCPTCSTRLPPSKLPYFSPPHLSLWCGSHISVPLALTPSLFLSAPPIPAILVDSQSVYHQPFMVYIT
jgi:hypothetical protein